MSRHDISEEKWRIVGPLLSRRERDPRGRKPKWDDRSILNGVLCILKTGAPWRDLPPEFGPWQTVYSRFNQWAREGVWDEILEELSKDADWEGIMIDGSIVKLHQHGSGPKGGRKDRK
jgi:transposase